MFSPPVQISTVDCRNGLAPNTLPLSAAGLVALQSTSILVRHNPSDSFYSSSNIFSLLTNSYFPLFGDQQKNYYKVSDITTLANLLLVFSNQPLQFLKSLKWQEVNTQKFHTLGKKQRCVSFLIIVQLTIADRLKKISLCKKHNSS